MMKTYSSAITAATELPNMPDPEIYPTKFIQWIDDICQLISIIYNVDFDTVVVDLQAELGLLEDEI